MSETLSSAESSVLNAIKAGNSRQGKIAEATSLPAQILENTLRKLKRAKLATFAKGSGPGTGWQPVAAVEGEPAQVAAEASEAEHAADVERQAGDTGPCAVHPEHNYAVQDVDGELIPVCPAPAEPAPEGKAIPPVIVESIDNAAKKVAAKRVKKAAAKRDTVVYYWTGEEPWQVRELAEGEDGETIADQLTAKGTPAVVGKRTIGAPEGAPIVDKTPEERKAAQVAMVERFDSQFPDGNPPVDEAPVHASDFTGVNPYTGEPTPAKPRKAPKLKLVPPSAPEPEAESATESNDEATPGTESNDEDQPADFLLFVGGAFYDKQTFINEAAELGISRRMPSHRLPADLVCGVSKVYVATGGARKAGEGEQAESVSEVFGYFIPQRIEYIASTDGSVSDTVALVASLGLREDTTVITSTQKEPERACGVRQQGGTYLVVDQANSPLQLLDESATYVGNHFRGTMKLTPADAAMFAAGGIVRTLIDEVCMVPTCDVEGGRAFKCAPDGHQRAERERRRIAKGEAPKWLLACGACRAKAMAAKAAERRAAKLATDPTSSPSPDGETEEPVAEFQPGG